MNEPLLYRRARPEDAARIDEQQRQRCSRCTEKCRTPLPACHGRVTLRQIVKDCLPTASVMLLCAGIAALSSLLFKAAP